MPRKKIPMPTLERPTSEAAERLPAAYLFLDEGGDLNFSPQGTRYFTITCVRVFRPFPCDQSLSEIRFDLIEKGLDIEFFHASEDRQATRDRVFSILQSSLSRFHVDCIIVEKRKTDPALRDDRTFYPRMLGYLLRSLLSQRLTAMLP